MNSCYYDRSLNRREYTGMYPFALLIGGLLMGAAAFATARLYLAAGLVLAVWLAAAGALRLRRLARSRTRNQ